MMRTGFAFGLANVAVALALLWILPAGRKMLAERIAAIIVACALLAGFLVAERLQRWAEVAVYQEPVIYAHSTPYQRIVLTRGNGDLRLFLNGNLQFSSRDEYRYHEALVWPALGRVANPRNVLILGGGDGLAAREVLRDARVARVTGSTHEALLRRRRRRQNLSDIANSLGIEHDVRECATDVD